MRTAVSFAAILAVVTVATAEASTSSWLPASALHGNAGQRTLAFFTDDRSVLCREFDEDVWSDPRLNDATKSMRLVRVDTREPTGRELAHKYQVPCVPVLLVLDGEKEVRRLERESERELVLGFLQGKHIAQANGPSVGKSEAGVDLTCQPDSTGDNASGNLDIVQVCAGEIGSNIQVQITCAAAPELKSAASYNVFIDTDGKEDTGSQTGGGSGADRLIQGGILYKFSGASPGEWKWDKIGGATTEVRGKILILTVPKSTLGLSGGARVWVGTQTPDFKPADWAPQTGPLPLSGGVAQAVASSSSAGALQSTAESSAATVGGTPIQGEALATLDDPTGDAPPLLDIQKVRAAMDSEKLLIQFELGGKPPLNSIHIFFNSDGKDDTGYTDGAHPGAEFMVEGSTLYKHKADAGTGWGWDASGPLSPAPIQQGKTVTIAIPRSRIGLTKDSSISVWFATTDASWTTADTAPDSGGWKYPEK